MSVNRVVAYHIERLKDKNPEVRMKSITELRLIGDVAALEALEKVFRTDEDLEIRKAAQAAGREIFLKNKH